MPTVSKNTGAGSKQLTRKKQVIQNKSSMLVNSNLWMGRFLNYQQNLPTNFLVFLLMGQYRFYMQN